MDIITLRNNVLGKLQREKRCARFWFTVLFVEKLSSR